MHRRVALKASAAALVGCRVSGRVLGIDETDCVEHSPGLLRSFTLPVPLYEDTSAWRQEVLSEELKSNHEKRIHELYWMLHGHGHDSIHLNFLEYTIPVFAAHPHAKYEEVELRTYFNSSWPTSTLYEQQAEREKKYYVKQTPEPEGKIRPSCPASEQSDGHMVLVDLADGTEYDYWASTTKLDQFGDSSGGGVVGSDILFAGSIERFSLQGAGAQEPAADCVPRGSARATGVPLLAGLLLPEDFSKTDEIEHALAFAIPRLRSIYPVCESTPPDYVYPATKTERSAFTASPWAIGAGERLRLRSQLVDTEGKDIDEAGLRPVTQKFLTALRKHGAILVDGSGGFTFYAEDVATANLELPDREFDILVDNRVPANDGNERTRWHKLMDSLLDDLVRIPFAFLSDEGLRSNFDIVANAAPPSGFESQCSVDEINRHSDEF